MLKYCISTLAVLLMLSSVAAYEVNDTLSLNGILSGAVQCQDITNAPEENTCETAVPFQPSLTYRPSNQDTFYLKLGFTSGNGLNNVTPFVITPWGADMEDDVENVNGSGRDHLLEAWYRHFFALQQSNSLELTLGIIDGSRYLDQNAYANDEYTQFMNPALSNAPNTFLPSYDLGVAAEWFLHNWSFAAVVMDVHQYTTDDKYLFYGLQAAYTLNTNLGIGNYRILLNGDRNLIDEVGQSKQKNDLLILSLDQALGKTVGVFTRLGWRLDDEPINYHAIYSAGIDIKGTAWARERDNIGIGYAYLSGGSRNIIRTQIAETYYRLVATDYLALTADIQYMRDEKVSNNNPKGFIYGLRVAIEF